MSDSLSQITVVNKIVLMTNFRTMFPETISTINLINEALEERGFKLLLLSNNISDELKCAVIQIPFSLKDYSSFQMDYSDHSFNPNLLVIDAEFNEDKNPDYKVYELGLKKCYSFARKIASEFKPAFAFLWSGTVPQSIIFKQVFSEYFIPTFFVERGLLPESLIFDELGNGACSALKKKIDLRFAPKNFEEVYNEVRSYFFTNKIDKHEQPDYLSSSEFLKQQNLEGKTIITFLGQWDVASGVNSTSDFQSYMNSPYFSSTKEAFVHLTKAVALKENYFLIFKPHPFDNIKYSNPDESKILIDKKINIRTLIEAADVIAVMSTTVQYEALLYDKPIIVLGNSYLQGHNIGYTIYSKEDLPDIIEQAIKQVCFEDKLENAKKFLSLICTEYLVSVNNENPISIKLKDFLSTLKKKYYLTANSFGNDIDNSDRFEYLRQLLSDESLELIAADLIEKANTYIEENEFIEAKKKLIEVLTKYDDESVDAANSLAACEIILGNYNEADNIFKQIFDKDPSNETATANYNYLQTLLVGELENNGSNGERDYCDKQNSETNDETKIQTVKKHWNNVSNSKVSYNFRWWGSPTIWNHYNRLTSGNEGGLIQLLKQNLNGRILEKGISVGCGIGVTEMNLILKGVVKHFDLYELSDVRIAKGLERAKELNILDKITFHNEDVFNSIENESVDLVYWYDALHHMFDVDYTVKWCKKILKNEGFFCMNEYTGPSRFQFSDKSLEIASAIRSALPKKYLIDPRDGSYFNPICYKPNAIALAKDDPSEAVDSGRIIQSVKNYFPNAAIKKLGGLVYMRVLDDIICNFNENDSKDLELLKALLDIDKALIQLTDVDNLYSAAIAQKKNQ